MAQSRRCIGHFKIITKIALNRTDIYIHIARKQQKVIMDQALDQGIKVQKRVSKLHDFSRITDTG